MTERWPFGIKTPSVILLVAGLALAAWSARELGLQNAEERRQRFERRVERTLTELTRRIDRYERGVRGVRGVILSTGSDALNHATMLRYAGSRDYASEFPGARGFGFVRRVPLAEEARFLQRLRREARSHQKIRFLGPHDGDRWVIEYIEPEADNLNAVGLDIASESNRRNALLRAIDSGQATLTHPITLVQASGKTLQGFLLLLPIYRLHGEEIGSADQVPPAERQARATALAYTPLVIEEVLADFQLAEEGLTIALADIQDTRAQRFYSTHAGEPADGQTFKRTLALYGRQWEVELSATDKMFADLAQVSPRLRALELAGGVLFATIILNLWLRARARHTRQLQHELEEEQRHRTEIAALNAGLEQRVVERTAQLQRALTEQQTLNVAMSHDLATPLRSIQGFSRILLKEQAASLSPAAQDYLKRIDAAARHMGLLIDDLLNLSGFSTHALQRQPVNLTALAEDCLAVLQQAAPMRQVEVRLAPDLRESADLKLVAQLLDVLLGNAWKYTAPVPRARIELDCSLVDGETVYQVRDNGVGFDMAYAHKLFNAFQRLHRQEEFPGRGIGLVTAKRIVEHHGGRIWAESSPGKGATFYFTLSPHVHVEGSRDE